MHSDAPIVLRGRAHELALLDGFLDAVCNGDSRSLLLRGEPGIGKTALLAHMAASPRALRVIRTAGAKPEMELPYAGLQHLCVPLLGAIERVPAPQRQALEVAFGLRTGAEPSRFLVGLGVLSLMAGAADERPLLCLVDDAHWLDDASTMTLAFVARRLTAERIGVVFAAREPVEELRHVTSLDVHGLRDDDARALLRSAVPFKVDEQVREHLIAEARGNPLTLLELRRGLTAIQLAGGFGGLRSKALRGDPDAGVLRRLESLSPDARRLLLLAAAEPLGEPLLLWRAAEGVAIDRAAGDEVQQQELLELGERVVFGDPLIRSAVYETAGAQERRVIHGALAAATDRATDPDRRAWHLAAAAIWPDEEVAAELERSAGHARRRGGYAAAGAFLRRALALTADPDRRADRALAAAAASLEAGGFDDARGLLAVADAAELDDLQRAQADALRGRLALSSAAADAREAPALLLDVARRVQAVDPGLARDAYLDAYAGALLTGDPASVRVVARAARSVPHAAGGTRIVAHSARHAPARPAVVAHSAPATSRGDGDALDLLLRGLTTLVLDGRTAAAPLLERATTALLASDGSPRSSFLTVLPAWILWDEERAHALCTRSVEATRDSGAATRLQFDLSVLGVIAARWGDFDAAQRATAEADALATALGTSVAPSGAPLLAALRGSEEPARSRFARTATAGGTGVLPGLVEWSTAVLCNGLGRYQDAIAAARDASDDLHVSTWVTLELLEAATRTGDEALAHGAFERILEAAAVADTDAARGIAARSRALVSKGETASRLYREALQRLGRTRLRPELARTHLLYGEWLRRENRRVDARGELRVAYDQLTAIGMTAFAERARTELRATGEKVRTRAIETRDDLTPQERQIAELARNGLSNPEIGEQLFLSPRTVEWHLRKVFAKLEIKSRMGLYDALGALDREAAPA